MIEPSRELRDACAIVGAGNSRLGQVPGVSSLDLLVEAMRNALDDAGLKAPTSTASSAAGPMIPIAITSSIGERLGINARFSTTLDNGGASQILSVALATMAIKAGLATTVICGYGRDAWSRTHKSRRSAREERDPARRPAARRNSARNTAISARSRRTPSAPRGTCISTAPRATSSATIAVAFREHALRNPDAQMKKPLTHRRLSRGAADRVAVRAVRLQPAQRRRRRGHRHQRASVRTTCASRRCSIKGFGSFNNRAAGFNDDNMVVTAAKQSGETAYRMAGLGPSTSTPRRSTIASPTWCWRSSRITASARRARAGRSSPRARCAWAGGCPTNTSGGQLSEAHVEGMLQIVEGVRQMRHTYPAERQVKDAEIALISGHGGNQVCHSTLILGRA